jgi:hypothetical protein
LNSRKSAIPLGITLPQIRADLALARNPERLRKIAEESQSKRHSSAVGWKIHEFSGPFEGMKASGTRPHGCRSSIHPVILPILQSRENSPMIPLLFPPQTLHGRAVLSGIAEFVPLALIALPAAFSPAVFENPWFTKSAGNCLQSVLQTRTTARVSQRRSDGCIHQPSLICPGALVAFDLRIAGEMGLAANGVNILSRPFTICGCVSRSHGAFIRRRKLCARHWRNPRAHRKSDERLSELTHEKSLLLLQIGALEKRAAELAGRLSAQETAKQQLRGLQRTQREFRRANSALDQKLFSAVRQITELADQTRRAECQKTDRETETPPERCGLMHSLDRPVLSVQRDSAQCIVLTCRQCITIVRLFVAREFLCCGKPLKIHVTLSRVVRNTLLRDLPSNSYSHSL